MWAVANVPASVLLPLFGWRRDNEETMLLFRPRSWCVYCLMGTLTQLIYQQKINNLENIISLSLKRNEQGDYLFVTKIDMEICRQDNVNWSKED